jgi:two-component system NtrC family sensor kinase
MRSLSAKLMLGLTAALAAIFLGLGTANLRLLRANLESAAVVNAEHMADVIFRSTRETMLANDRSGQIRLIRSIGAQPDVLRVRVFGEDGAVQYSTDAAEVGRQIETSRSSRIYNTGRQRAVEVIRPIKNENACSNASCHAHGSSQAILGVLDVALSLEAVDRTLATHEQRMQAQVLFSAALFTAIAGTLVWLLINRPVQHLAKGVRALAAGDLSHRVEFHSHDELGELAASFNQMAGALDTAQRTLEQRIQAKTRDLEAAREKLIHSEKLSSLGQLAAAVAHEINNPLAGILTYARLLEKKLAPGKPALDWIQTIQHESRRCGDIVTSLLSFARKQNTEMAPASIESIVERTLAVTKHKLDMQAITLETVIDPMPEIVCDAMQIQQVLVAIIMNAVDAMGQGGNLCIRAGVQDGRARLSVTNNGPPIPAEALPHLFEPFFSTKTAASGVGLGLAVAYGIVQKHGGEIQVETGELTKFHILLPLEQRPEQGNDRRQEIHSHR